MVVDAVGVGWNAGIPCSVLGLAISSAAMNQETKIKVCALRAMASGPGRIRVLVTDVLGSRIFEGGTKKRQAPAKDHAPASRQTGSMRWRKSVCPEVLEEEDTCGVGG